MNALQKRTTEITFRPEEVCIEKDKVVMFSPSSDPPLPINIWDLNANRVHEIRSSRRVWFWHIDVDGNEFVTFEINWEKHPLEVQRTKWTLTGQPLDRKHIHLSLPDRVKFSLPRLVPKQYTFGHKTVSPLVSWPGYDFMMMDLIYDHDVDKLSLRWIDRALPQKTTFRRRLSQVLTPYISYHWYPYFNRIDICNAASGTATTHAYQLDRREMVTFEKSLAARRQPKI